MDSSFYSDKAIQKFVKTTLCQGDKKLYNHYMNDDVFNFRERLSRKFTKEQQDKIEQVVYSCVTDSIRDIIYEIIGKISKLMKYAGDVIITGGDAFNMYFEKDDRIITSDIDTKFVPIFKSSTGTLISTKNPKYFGFLQSVKIFLWEKLGEIAVQYNKRITNRITRLLKNTKIGKMLGISFNTKSPCVTRRYSLIQKERQSLTTNKVTLNDILIDVELFALDLKINYYSIVNKHVTPFNLGGILDMAIMRPYEVGYEVAFTRNQGVLYQNKDTGKMINNKSILFAGKYFLMEDVYLMQLLGLRPAKKIKDKNRMIIFATKILKIKTISKNDSFYNIFKKCLPKLLDVSTRVSIKTRKVFKMKYTICNPLKYKKYTTVPWLSGIPLLGLKSTFKNKTFPGYYRTSGKYKFNLNHKKWIINNSNNYIKNEMNFRIYKQPSKIPKLHLKNILYGYNPVRDSWMPQTLVNKAAIIPLVGLKNTSFVY